MSTPMTPDRAYDALGLDEDTPRKEIRKAYFRLALKHHPDKAKNEQAKKRANEQFQEIQSAYETLTQDRSEDAQPSLDALRRQKAQPSRAWTDYVGHSSRKEDHEAYGQEDEDEDVDDVRYGEEPEDEDDRHCHSDLDKSEDEEKSVWPTVEMRTTGYIDPIYGEKKTLSENAPEKLVIGDGIKDVTFTVEKEQWEDFRAAADNTPFVFEPPPLRKTIHGNASALTSKEATRLNRPPPNSSMGYGEALTSRIMPRGLPRVIAMTEDGLPIHEGEDPKLIKLRGNYLTAALWIPADSLAEQGSAVSDSRSVRTTSR